MIFVLTMLFSLLKIVRTKIIGHYSLFITHYSLLITRNTNTWRNVIFFIEKDMSLGSFWLFYKLSELTSLKPMQMYFLLFRAPKMTSFPVT